MFLSLLKSRLKLQVASAISALLGLIALGTIMYKLLEDWTWIQSFYFSVTTLSTVGYGDLHPTTDLSRLFTAFYVIIGVSIVLSALAIIGKNYLEKREKRILERRERKRK
jgi:voltage-gated potassium channel